MAERDSGPKRVVRALAWTRDAWLIVGLALLLMVGLEAAHRAQAEVRRAVRGGDANPIHEAHPYADEDWWARWQAGEGSWRTRYDPYRALWPEPRSGAYLNIDSLGRRHTVQPMVGSAAVTHRVFLLGGSTMFGYTARDEGTIPSQLAALLEIEGIRGTSVANLAQSRFNVTQGLNTLTLELRAGRVPDAVVFLDGNNEVAPAFQTGRAGGVLNQPALEELFQGDGPSVAERLLETFSFVGRIGAAVGLPPDEGESPGPPPWAATPEPLCDDVAETYLAVRSVIEHLGDAWGFETYFFWQPMYATSSKVPTAFERTIRSPEGWRSMVVACTAAVRRRAAETNAGHLVFMDDLFDDETGSVFLDDYGHVTEEANRIIAGGILRELRDGLRRPAGS